jgi:hypothetical protein
LQGGALTVIKFWSMKKLFTPLIILIFLSQSNGLTQPIGFAETECGIISNQHYYYENYYYSGHGGGYRLYHNGNLIYEESDIFTPISGRELKFIDDTTGFFVVFDGPGWSMNIYKIINNSVVTMGSCSGNLFHSFVVSRHTIYVSSYLSDSSYDWLYITRLSDLKPQKKLLETNYVVPDTTFYDTIYGLPLCQGLNAINYLYKNFNDTLIYTIQFNTDTLVYLSLINESSHIIAPNPASDIIRILSPSYEKVKSITILDNLGRKRKQIKVDNTIGLEFDIRDLEIGIYFLVVENEITWWICKFVKI